METEQNGEPSGNANTDHARTAYLKSRRDGPAVDLNNIDSGFGLHNTCNPACGREHEPKAGARLNQSAADSTRFEDTNTYVCVVLTCKSLCTQPAARWRGVRSRASRICGPLCVQHDHKVWLQLQRCTQPAKHMNAMC